MGNMNVYVKTFALVDRSDAMLIPLIIDIYTSTVLLGDGHPTATTSSIQGTHLPRERSGCTKAT
jgi:hypothetical protein